MHNVTTEAHPEEENGGTRRWRREKKKRKKEKEKISHTKKERRLERVRIEWMQAKQMHGVQEHTAATVWCTGTRDSSSFFCVRACPSLNLQESTDSTPFCSSFSCRCCCCSCTDGLLVLARLLGVLLLVVQQIIDVSSSDCSHSGGRKEQMRRGGTKIFERRMNGAMEGRGGSREEKEGATKREGVSDAAGVDDRLLSSCIEEEAR